LDALDFISPIIGAPYEEKLASFQAVERPGETAAVAVDGKYADYQRMTYRTDVQTLSGARGRTRLAQAIHRLLRVEKPGSLEARFANAVAWAGRANVQRRRDQAFLMKMIALESALSLADGRNSTTERLRLRVAHVVGGAPKERHALYRQMQDFYHLRSSIVHAGVGEPLTDETMKAVTALTRKVLERLLVRAPFSRMKSESELEDWFHGQMLLGGQSKKRSAR
jgi:hypothetical protein